MADSTCLKMHIAITTVAIATSGTIEIADKFSLVEVPESAADDVVAALRQAGIRGRTATVRRERYEAR